MIFRNHLNKGFLVLWGCFLLTHSASLYAARNTYPVSFFFANRDTGVPLSGNQSVTFKIYSTATTVSPLWSETQTVSFSGGVANASLGSATSLPTDLASGNTTLFLGITEGGEEASPRVELSATPWAEWAGTCDVANTLASDATLSSSAIATDAVTTAKIQSGAVTSAKIADGAVSATKIDQSISPTWSGNHTFSGNVTQNGFVRYGVQTVTIPAGTPINDTGTTGATLTPTNTYVEMDCQDTDGTSVTISETGAQAGQLLIIANIGSQNCDILKITDQVLVPDSGMGSIRIKPTDTIVFIYASSQWLQLSKASNNNGA